jgi:hypothetical protein
MQCASSTTNRPQRRDRAGQLLLAEARVDQAFGRDEQHVDLVGRQRRAPRLPVGHVRRVHRHRPDAGALGGADLVAHQRQQRRDDERRPAARGRAQQGVATK